MGKSRFSNLQCTSKLMPYLIKVLSHKCLRHCHSIKTVHYCRPVLTCPSIFRITILQNSLDGCFFLCLNLLSVSFGYFVSQLPNLSSDKKDVVLWLYTLFNTTFFLLVHIFYNLCSYLIRVNHFYAGEPNVKVVEHLSLSFSSPLSLYIYKVAEGKH